MNRTIHHSLIQLSLLILISCILMACNEFGGNLALMWDRIRQILRIAHSQVDLLDEHSIPEIPVEYRGRISLELKGTIELAFEENTPGVGSVDRLIFTSDQSFILSDVISGEVHEFGLEDGHYIRSFGRRGRGPGEYGKVSDIWICPNGYVYAHDHIFAQVFRYNRQGVYIGKLNTRRAISILADQDCNMLIVSSRLPDHIVEFKKVNPENGQVQYNVGLSTKKNDINVYAIGRLVYHRTLNHLYHFDSTGYSIKEIDVSTGKVLGRFGWRASEFVPLDQKYNIDDIEQVSKVLSSCSRLNKASLLNERYLIVCYAIPSGLFGAVYDIIASDVIPVYSFDEKAVKFILEATELATHKNYLYLYKTPTMEKANVSNGQLDYYTLSLP